MSCSGDQHRFTARAASCDCGQTTSTLAANGLPYPSWILDETSRRGTRHSNYALATDPRSAHTYLVREYVPDAVPDPTNQRRRFIATAKSLRSCAVPAQAVLFAYTRNGQCFTVANPPAGTPLPAFHSPGRTSEPDCVSRLAALLTALQQLHAAGAAAGPLFHANLRSEHIFAPGPNPDAPVELAHSLYLDNLLRESPLPPEHFQQGDITAAADVVLTLAQASATPSDRAYRLQRIADPVLGATLEYLFGIHNARPQSAKAALDYLHLLQRAASSGDRNLFQQARTLSPSPRLLRLASAPPPTPPPQPRPAPPPAGQPAPVQQTFQSPPPPPPQPAYTPVATKQPSAASPRPSPPARKRRSGCGGCLLTLVLALLVIGAVVTILVNRPSTATSLDFSADPNPAPYKTRVELHWSSSGFDHLELDGKPVDPIGSQYVIANSSRRYALAGIRTNGTREIRDVYLTVLPRRAPKPSPGTFQKKPPPQSLEPDRSAGTGPVQTATPVEARTENAQPPINTPSSTTPGLEAPNPAAQQPTDVQGATTALHQWASAMLSNDPDREAACYAPQVDRYFLQSGVTQDFVHNYLIRVRQGGTTFTQFDLSNLLTIPEPDGSVQARFNKEVTYNTPTGTKHQTAHSILHLRPVNGSWKITSERDFRGPTSQP